MKKILLRMVALLIAVLLSLSAGCSSRTTNEQDISSTTQKSETITNIEKPVKLSIIKGSGGRIVKEDSPVMKAVQEKTNTIIDLQLIPANEFKNKLNLMIASKQYPDIVCVSNIRDYLSSAPGLFLDITKEVNEYGINMKKVISKEAWNQISVDGKYYCVPTENWQGKYQYVIRQDWLDNLGIKSPTNLTELEDMLKKFTFSDPDKNGKDDTYGLGTLGSGSAIPADFQMIFGAFGLIAQSDPVAIAKDNKVYDQILTSEYKECVSYVRKLYYEDKVIDPDAFIIKSDEATQKIINGKIGSVTAWWSIPEQVLMQQMKMREINPKAKWRIADPIKGNKGQWGFVATSLISNTVGITDNCKNVPAAIKLIDFLVSDEGAILANFGIKDVHYTMANSKFAGLTVEGTKAFNEKWLDNLSGIVLRNDIIMESTRVSDPEAYKYAIAAKESNLYQNVFDKIVTEDSMKYGADIKKIQEGWFIKFITGAEPLSKWDTFIKEYKDAKANVVFNSLLKEYNSRFGKNLAIGE